MFRRSFRRGGCRLGMVLFLLIGGVACGGSREERLDSDAAALTPPALREVQEGEGRETSSLSQTAPGVSRGLPGAALSSPHGRVLAGKELGVAVTGKGAGEPSRALEVMEGHLLSFLPQLQEIYNREREQDPGLMGSLDVNLTVEPGGEVSDLRFPFRRVSGEKLTATVFDRIRTWTFPPAEEQVQLRYTLLFVPPGIDPASVAVWEKQLANRAVMDRGGESRSEGHTATAAVPAKKPSPTVAAAARPAKKSSPAASPRAKAAEATPPVAYGWHRVIRPTVLYAAPRDSSDVVAQLSPGTRVRVVSLAAGEWLEVHSRAGRPPGFLRRGDAAPELGERAGW